MTCAGPADQLVHNVGVLAGEHHYMRKVVAASGVNAGSDQKDAEEGS